MIGVGHTPARGRPGAIAVGKVGPAIFEQQGVVAGLHLVPAELRHPHALAEAGDVAGRDPQPAHPGALVAALEQELVTDTDRDGGPIRPGPLDQRPVHPALLQAPHGGTERTDARQHDVTGLFDVTPGFRNPGLGPQPAECRLDRGDVGGSGRYDDDVRHDQSIPLVLGMSPYPPRDTACRRASARALNAASARWWSFSPRTRST